MLILPGMLARIEARPTHGTFSSMNISSLK